MMTALAESYVPLVAGHVAELRDEGLLREDLFIDGEWVPAADGVLVFDRGATVRCVVNISGQAARLPEHAGLLLSSGPMDSELLPPDSAVWLRTGNA